jgi:succinate dehydrogenase / fumarate reductase cytochrome b subunit
MNITFIKRIVLTSIGRKTIMAITGLMLSGFMMFHLGANLILFKGEVAFNNKVDFLMSNPLLPLLELGLLALFLTHIFFGIWVRLEDWLNAPSGYEARNWQGGRTIGSASMLYTAAFVLAFLAYHLLTFRFVDHSLGFYQMVSSAFRDRVFVAIYVGGAVALILHLSHGLQSSFQTLGLHHPKYTPFIKIGGWLLAVTMIGFVLISVYFLMNLDIKAAAETYQVTIQ